MVRPTYSYMGDFIISDSVVTDIANCVADEVDGISEVVSVFENTEPDNLMLQVVVDIDRGTAIWSVAEEYQKRLSKVVEDMTAFNVVETDVEVRQLVNRR
ncbi:MAG: Asp23/Gls24 family envelope stress response protein [Eubacterium sp.]|nr:Asp23/Gls24 family envelope stress response protein [Eubacterium sp.]